MSATDLADTLPDDHSTPDLLTVSCDDPPTCRPALPRIKSCLKNSPSHSGTSTPLHDDDGSPPPIKKHVAFCEEGTEEVHEADEWDRTPAEIQHLTYDDVLKLKKLLPVQSNLLTLSRPNHSQTSFSPRYPSHYYLSIQPPSRRVDTYLRLQVHHPMPYPLQRHLALHVIPTFPHRRRYCHLIISPCLLPQYLYSPHMHLRLPRSSSLIFLLENERFHLYHS